MLNIGLTGGIGSGKTAVTTHFQSLGVPVIDADEVSRDLVKRGLPAYYAIMDAFGRQVLDDAGELDRRKLRALIFTDVDAKSTLEAILHPLIYDEIRSQLSALSSPYCIISIPLLLEVGDLSLIDRILVIDVEPALQVTRVLSRDGGTREQVEAIIASQVNRQTRVSFADDVIVNESDMAQLKVGVTRLHAKFLAINQSS